METKFYQCKHCGKIIAIVKGNSTPTICCGECMTELKPNFMDADKEKHVPFIARDMNIVTVTVGTEFHPMTAEHHIEWILLKTDKGIQMKKLEVGFTPQADFPVMSDEKVETAYAYCNLHKLWKK